MQKWVAGITNLNYGVYRKGLQVPKQSLVPRVNRTRSPNSGKGLVGQLLSLLSKG